MHNPEQIRSLEEFYFKAWQAFETHTYDGWHLRFAEGYTRRANSINPLYGSSLPLDEKIAHCINEFIHREITPVFKLTDAAIPHDLDAQLDRRGYMKGTIVSIQTADMRPRTFARSDLAVSDDTLTDAWLDDFCRLNIVDEKQLSPMRRLLNGLTLETCYLRLIDGRETVAVGLGVCDGHHIGLFDIVTAIAHRRKGHGYALVESLLHWGQSLGATVGTLQVVHDNIPALRLYERFGFSEAYTYWYRSPPV